MKPLAGPFLELVWRTPALRKGAVFCIVLALISSAAEIAVALSLIPILTSLGIDAGDELGSFVARVPPAGWLALFAIAAILRSAINWLSSIQQQRGTQELVLSLQSRLYRALAGAHWDAVRRVSPSSLTSALQTQSYDAGYGFSGLVQVISASLLVLGYLLSSVAVFPLVLPALLLLLVFMWRLNSRSSKQVTSRSEDYYDAATSLHQRYEDWVAISRIAALGVDSGSLADRFEADARSVASHAIGFSHSYAATRASYEAALVVAILIGVPVAWSLETPPALLAFGLILLLRTLPRAGSIHSGYQGILNAAAPLRNIERLIEQLERDPARQSSSSKPLDWRNLELSDVGIEDTLRDDGEHWILKGISLHLEHGEWLALSGPTGAGKTTLADVMLMLLRPDAGKILIDGENVDEATASRWRDQAAYVPQDVVLFEASIRDNLRLYVPDATDSELQAALKQAAADFVMTRLPEGLDTRVGPGGRWLSGGERQRIGIARALLRKPGFLVLDEPTAALDGDTQTKLMDALAKLEQTMTVVIITHRLELLKLADRIIEIKDGELRYSGQDQSRP
jgi:ATP-binding cassette subfamily C protein